MPPTIFPKVPILGLQKRLVRIPFTMATVVCICDCSSEEPIVVPNFDKAGICLACKQKYVIAELNFKNDNGLITMNTKVAKWAGPTSAMPNLDVHTMMEPSGQKS